MTPIRTLAARTAAALALALGAGLAHAESPTVAPEIDGFVATLSRAEVRAQTLAAGAAGAIARNDAQAEQLAAVPVRSMLSRAQVLAEAVEARRLGLVAHGEQALPEATPAQLERIRMAGLRALTRTAAR